MKKLAEGKPLTWAGWWVVALLGCSGPVEEPSVVPAKETPVQQLQPEADGAFHVHPGMDIQSALDAAARQPQHKTVKVHAGEYGPQKPGFALIWFNVQHDGVRLEAVGEVTLTAANPQVANRQVLSYPALVNHVVYFGDRVSPKTTFQGFKVTGANHFLCPDELATGVEHAVHPRFVDRGQFFYADGGGIKIYGRSYPTIVGVHVVENYASPCGGGVSVEHRGLADSAVTFRDCVFRGNRCRITGSAVDLLPGSSAVFENCLFVGNIANLGTDNISPAGEEFNREHGSGALTVFPHSQAEVRRCTFTGNWNGVDDKGAKNVYEQNIFWNNTAKGGISPGGRYEIDILDGARVTRCAFQGEIEDVRGVVSRDANLFDAPDPQFDEAFRPRAPEYKDLGYRPPGP